MLKTAVILAGGLGTRLQQVVKDLPKPMAPVNGKPFLNYQLDYLKHYGFSRVIFSLGYKAQQIKDFYKSNYKGLQIDYVEEQIPLGTGGGIRLALEACGDPNVLALNGDSFFDVPLDIFYRLHEQNQAQVSLALRKVADASRYGTIQKAEQYRIISFKEKNKNATEGLINGGVYILDRSLYLANTPAGRSFSIEKDFFEKELSYHRILGFEFNTYFIDIGVPHDYQKAQDDLKGFKY